MNKYICTLANIRQIEKRWEEKEKRDLSDKSIAIWKLNAINGFKAGKRLYYYGFLGDEVICEAAALLKECEVQNGAGLAGDKTAYLSAFKTEENYRGKGYFSVLYKFMEEDLKKRGYEKLTLGVEAEDEKNLMIYKKWGYNEFIKTACEYYPSENGEDTEEIVINYYAKRI